MSLSKIYQSQLSPCDINLSNYTFANQKMQAAGEMYSFFREWFSLDNGIQKIHNIPFQMKVDNVSLVERFSSRRNAVGSLYLTPTHLIYVDHDNKRETWILHSHISSAGKLPLSTSGSPLQIRTKTFLSMTFIIPKERDAHDLYTSLNKMCQPENIEDLYCFRYNIGSDEMPKNYGWSSFKIQMDFERMNVPPDAWTMTTLNEDYDLCDTYPRHIYVPTAAATSVLIGSSRFRSRGRLPVMTYMHKNKAALCRCSQPLSGFSARCVEDENLLVCIQKANPNTAQLVVVDTRPRINAMANRAAGKGYESEANYENTRFMFAGIDNIHVMRSSLSKVVETCDSKTQQMSAFLNGLESSGWLRHIKSIVDAALSVARTLDDGSSVLVHCSDGWDRTAQVCGLAQIMLDPYYRTFDGFQALICKEWLEFGHKFTDRSGHIQIDPKEVSPVFTQWLECIWQLSQQFPFLFEFNERLLLTVHDHLHSCQFGTFIGNCQKDRIDLRVSEKTYSIWGYLATHKSEYINPLYQMEANNCFIIPNVAPQTFKFWRGMYCRWENGLHPRESLLDLASSYKDHIHSLNDHIKLLKSRIKNLETAKPYLNGSNSEISADDNRLQYQKGISEENFKVQRKLKDNNQIIDGIQNWKSNDNCEKVYPFSFENEQQLTPEGGQKNISLGVLTEELESIALEWKSVRTATECPCSTPLDFSSFKRHCCRCGGIFCSRCLEKLATLPGHITIKQSRVCDICYKACFPKSLDSPE